MVNNPWTTKEGRAFFHGVDVYGWGKWASIANSGYLPGRDAASIKSHGQWLKKKCAKDPHGFFRYISAIMLRPDDDNLGEFAPDMFD